MGVNRSRKEQTRTSTKICKISIFKFQKKIWQKFFQKKIFQKFFRFFFSKFFRFFFKIFKKKFFSKNQKKFRKNFFEKNFEPSAKREDQTWFHKVLQIFVDVRVCSFRLLLTPSGTTRDRVTKRKLTPINSLRPRLKNLDFSGLKGGKSPLIYYYATILLENLAFLFMHRYCFFFTVSHYLLQPLVYPVYMTALGHFF